MDWSFVEAESSDGKCVLELVDSEETKKARAAWLEEFSRAKCSLLLAGVAIWVSLHLHCGVERWWVGHCHESCNLASIGWRDGARVTPCYAIKPLLFLPLPYKDNLSESECTFTTGIHSNLPEDFWFFGCVLCLTSPVSMRTSNTVIVTLNNVQATMTSLTLTSLELRESLRVVPMRKLFRIHCFSCILRKHVKVCASMIQHARFAAFVLGCASIGSLWSLWCA